ncbi:MAG: NAD(+)/NADH kinase [Phycisphaerales bacterium]|nr:NAD(+)/NADH kinase [Phycisphaerales bacterium]
MSSRSLSGSAAETLQPLAKLVQRVAIVGSPAKPAAAELLPRVRVWVAARATVVYAEITHDAGQALATDPDLLMVLGGDGTLIAAVHGLGLRQVPILGINIGKLGYMADFMIEDLEREGNFLFSGHLQITRRAMMDVLLEGADGTSGRTLAVNDCVVTAGPPFHMIELHVTVDGDAVAEIRGDGLIVATPSGSTAHNLAAGGPIVEPTGEVFILTPICPQALTYRPLVLHAGHRITVETSHANEGTTVVVDGRVTKPLASGDRVVITRYGADFLLVRNPRHSEWHALRRKLRWGEGPAMNGTPRQESAGT